MCSTLASSSPTKGLTAVCNPPHLETIYMHGHQVGGPPSLRVMSPDVLEKTMKHPSSWQKLDGKKRPNIMLAWLVHLHVTCFLSSVACLCQPINNLGIRTRSLTKHIHTKENLFQTLGCGILVQTHHQLVGSRPSNLSTLRKIGL